MQEIYKNKELFTPVTIAERANLNVDDCERILRRFSKCFKPFHNYQIGKDTVYSFFEDQTEEIRKINEYVRHLFDVKL